MRTMPPPLLPVLRSRLQAEVLACLFLHPSQELSLSDLSRRLGAAASTLHGEVGRLETAGLVTSRALGRNRMVTANTASRYFRPMAELLLLSFGPAQVVAEEFANVFGAERVVIFGSWARRLAGEAGPEPQDIDVLAVGDADRGSVYAAADRAQGRLHIDVNPVLRSVAQWDAASDALVASIKEGHHVTVKP